MERQWNNSMETPEEPHLFGIRHLSPSGAWHLREFLDETDPELVLIEGPSDFTELLQDLTEKEVKPPVAVMAYTAALPIRTLVYPLAVYSPEYQAALWAREKGRKVRFFDLPSSVFLALEEHEKKEKQTEERRETSEEEQKGERSGNRGDVYERLDQTAGTGGNEDFWEHVLEHSETEKGYRMGAAVFGTELRRLSEGEEGEKEGENRLRERYMLREIRRAEEEGISADRIAAVTGAFHIAGLLEGTPMTDEEFGALKQLPVQKTLMPYSYFRLSGLSGYGAGNRAPAYYELLWEGRKRRQADYGAIQYLARLAAFQRKEGSPVSSAEVIEALRLAAALAKLNGHENPSLQDLRDGATACMGHGNPGELSVAMADTEIGTVIGSLPHGVSQTSVQADFNRNLARLKLERFRGAAAQVLDLDLRENLAVKSEQAAFLDLNRSFFLHRLRILSVSFASLSDSRQTGATWKERWVLRWTPEAEMGLIESVLKGDTVEQAAAFELKSRADGAGEIGTLSEIIRDAFLCGMPESVAYTVSALQAMAVDAVSASELARAAGALSLVIQYGDIRRLDREPLIPVLKQLFLRLCLVFPGECRCDDDAAALLIPAMDTAARAAAAHDFLDERRLERTLREISERDDVNTRLSGFAGAILLESGKLSEAELSAEVSRRLSRGIPAELGAGWFEGLSMKNHYGLIARLSLWESLSRYLDTLDGEEFKRALVFLRRAFADFTSEEKNKIAENLGEIWQINPAAASEALNETLTAEETRELLDELGDFDFDDI